MSRGGLFFGCIRCLCLTVLGLGVSHEGCLDWIVSVGG